MIKMKRANVLSGLTKMMNGQFITFSVLILSSFFLIFYPNVMPLYDYPSHVARLYVLSLNGADPVIAEHISVNWHFVTNLALEIVTYPLLYFFEPDIAARIFICSALLVTSSGTIFLHRTLGGKGPWPYVVFLVIINDILLYGFLSFLFSIGLVLWIFACWIRAKRMHFCIKLIVFPISSIFIMTCHLYAFCFYALLVIAYETSLAIERHKETKPLISSNLLVAILQLIPSLIIFFLLSETSSQSSLVMGTLYGKLSGIASIISLYNIKLQIVLVTLIGLILIILWKRKYIKFASRMNIFLVSSAIIFLIAPMAAYGSYFLEFRMPVALVLPIIAAIQPKITSFKPILFWISLSFICLLHYTYIASQWSKFDKIYADMFAATETLKAGDRLAHIAIGRGAFSENLAPPLIHAPAYLIVDKKVITPFIFADARHQPISYTNINQLPSGVKPLIRSYNNDELIKLRDAVNATLPMNFDYLLLANFESSYLKNSKHWRLMAEKGIFQLYENKKVSE